MSLETILPWLQIAVSAALVMLILLQRSEGGISAISGGEEGGATFKKRGAERALFIATILCAIAFGLLAIISLFLRS